MATEGVVQRSDVNRTTIFLLRTLNMFSKASRWSPTIQKDFRVHRDATQVYEGHVHEVCRDLVKSRSAVVSKVALLLMQCCSQENYQDASLDLGVAFQANKRSGPRRQLGPTYDNDIAKMAMADLEQHASRGSVLAASLIAELVSSTQDPKASMRPWQRAIDLALRNHEALEQEVVAARFEHLRKPWVEAANVIWQVDQSKAREYLRIGMQMDDADAYAIYALQNYAYMHENDYIFLEWLNAATKAAASGSVRSAVALAHHYANSSATDLEEMLHPDRPEPTQSEKLKQRLELAYLWMTSKQKYQERSKAIADEDADRRAYNTIARVKRAEKGLNDYQASVAEFEASCKTPQDRIQMAIQWLELAHGYFNVEAALDLAFLHSRKYVYQLCNMQLAIKHPDDQTDEDIREILPDYEEYFGKDPELQEPYDGTKDLPSKTPDGRMILRRGIENPFYSEQKVKAYLCSVAYCRLAMQNVKSAGAKTWADKRDVEDKWYMFPDVASHNEQVIETCWQKAQKYADELGVDLWHDATPSMEPAMLYRHQGK
ncbi:RNA polymerase II transcription factor B subunit 2 [Elsinoe australis]|uniref:RNA polymerase II transcription factor B subunit 2 n=1 Tax=Elsinoe australis TaxID=40998 RepID=A0A2P7YGI7_9PEZI|nr:RNA polymerase II transcription factor B subunit 2 [Elsinoe australis]